MLVCPHSGGGGAHGVRARARSAVTFQRENFTVTSKAFFLIL
jgi:hypothetical protein